MVAELTSIYIFERDSNDNLFTWGFPSVEKDTESTLQKRCQLDRVPTEAISFCSRYQHLWQYFYTLPITSKDDAQDASGASHPVKVTAISIVLLSEVYNPPAFAALNTILAQLYISGNYTSSLVLPAYLSANSTGTLHTTIEASSTELKWSFASHDPRAALITPTHRLIEIFSFEVIIIWIAVILKRRIVVYHPHITDVVELARSIPTLGAWHRQSWGILRPFCSSSNGIIPQLELDDISAQQGAIIGTTDPHFIDKDGLWDVYLDAHNKSVSIYNNSKHYFSLNKFHKTIVEFIIEAHTNTPQSTIMTDMAQPVIKAAMIKTKEVIELVKSCKDDTGHVTPASIQQKNVPKALESFLYHLAQAEGLVQL